MTENATKMFVEDMIFIMREEVPNYKFDEATTRLTQKIDDQTKDGTLIIKP